MSNDSKEIGRVGQRRYGGIFYEEFLSELRGRKGAEVFTEMSNNDETIGAILFAIEMLVRQASWNVEPGGSTAKDREAAEFVKSCMDDMQQTWIDTISEILSFLTYGWSFHEIVYKRRMGRTKDNRTSSKYDDGLIGWMKLPIRSQETLYQWEYGDGSQWKKIYDANKDAIESAAKKYGKKSSDSGKWIYPGVSLIIP